MSILNLNTGTLVKCIALATASMIATPTFAAGLLTPKTGGYPELQIKEHHVNVVIEGGYAVTTIDQTFYNPNNTDLEALYSFPVPDKAAVGEFTYWIDGKPITGEVVKKEAAKTIYEAERQAGNEVAITEKDSYKTFDSTVYPVKPQSDVQIRLKYIQAAHVDLGVGRYVYPLEDGGVDEDRIGFWSTNNEVKEAFSFNLTMRSAYAVSDMRLPQHPQASLNMLSGQEWTASIGSVPGADNDNEGIIEGEVMPSSSAYNLDKDIVVYWRHEANLPGSVDMVTYKSQGSDRGTFMITVTPGDDLPEITEGRDWVFVLDLSGSMRGKYASLVAGVEKGLKKLNPNDRFKIVLFNNQARELTQGYMAVTPDNVNRYMTELSQVQPGGGTNLYAGIEKAFKGLDGDRPGAVLLVTDGVANVGTTEKKIFLKLLEQTDVRLHSFVMGNSANKPLLDGMATISNGTSMNISNSDDIVGRIVQTTARLNHAAYRDIDLSIKGRGIKIEDITKSRIGSLYRGQQLVVFGHYRGDGEAKLTIDGKVLADKRVYSSPVSFPKSATMHPELERLWAFAAIENIQNEMDYLGADSDSQDAITGLATEYGLVTDYTSMVVMREEQFQKYGIERNNAQRVAIEDAAQIARSQTAITDSRQDAQAPTFSSSRADVGAGAMGPWALFLLLPLLFFRQSKKQK